MLRGILARAATAAAARGAAAAPVDRVAAQRASALLFPAMASPFAATARRWLATEAPAAQESPDQPTAPQADKPPASGKPGREQRGSGGGRPRGKSDDGNRDAARAAGKPPGDRVPNSRPELLRRVLHIRRVARVNSGGKIRSVSALVIVGDQNGSAGYGMGRATDSGAAVRKAFAQAEKNMVFFERLDKRTIFSDIDHTYHKTNLKLRMARPGYGLVVNNHVHEVCRCIGITDLGGKVYGSLNPLNVIKGTFSALASQRSPADLARLRGKKVVDIQMAYYGAKV
ncbi:28S ribosomal protein S5, mitochondrial [Polyrhizophydium stewartii]|uniref:28S ribosomal protein S5, mitochondrial n=1 Tax=Polyrhizophydium stewartii TaxID=2732419 RepID=A0ABR4NJ99_9FUNG|nr:28S ribosomal protein S5, mitochondrial [Polyrhizophydium stewartii]